MNEELLTAVGCILEAIEYEELDDELKQILIDVLHNDLDVDEARQAFDGYIKDHIKEDE